MATDIDGSQTRPAGPASDVTPKPKYSRRSHIMGVLILLAISASFVCSSFVTQQLKMPFFCSYFNNSFSAVYIVAYFGKLLVRSRDQKHAPSRESLWKTHIETIKQAMLFMPLIFSMSVTFNWSLHKTSMSNNSVICSSSGFFALLFSWLLMRSPIRLVNMLGALISVLGIFLVSWFTESSDSSSIKGDAAALASAVLSGLYTSLISKRIPDGSPVNMTLFFGLIGLFGCILFLPAIFLLLHFGTEDSLIQITGSEIGKLFANATLTIAANLMWAKAVQLTSPFVASVGLGMTTPLTMLVDFSILNKRFGFAYCIGVALVILGYLITNIQHQNDGKRSLKEVNDKIEDFEKDDLGKVCVYSKN